MPRIDREWIKFMDRAKDPEAKIGIMNEEFRSGLWNLENIKKAKK